MKKWHTKISSGEGEDEGGPTLKSDIFEGENLIAEGLWFDQAEKIVEAHNK
jgi:hypothetical protein